MEEYQDRYIGFFWTHDKTKGKNKEPSAGELILGHDSSITLNLYGDGSIVDIQEIDKINSIGVILGVAKSVSTNKDHSFTLIKNVIAGWSRSSLISLTFKCSNAFVDFIVEDMNKFKIGVIFLQFKSLKEWTGKSGNQLDIDRNEEGRFAKIEHFPVSPISLLNIHNLEISVNFSASVQMGWNKGDKITETSYVCIKLKKRKSINYVYEILEKVNKFFSFVVGEALPIDLIELKQYTKDQSQKNKVEKNPKFRLITKQNKSYSRASQIHRDDMFLPLRVLQPLKVMLLKEWFKKYDDLKPALNLYFGKIYSDTQYEENAFLDMVFAIEVLHRTISPSIKLNEKKYKQKLNEKLDGLMKNDRCWVEARMKNSSDRTLLNRFQDIAENFEPIAQKIFSDTDSDFTKVVTTRNYLVHYEISGNLRSKVVPSKNLHKYTNKLVVLFQAILLYELTNDMDLVLDRIEKPFFNQLAMNC